MSRESVMITYLEPDNKINMFWIKVFYKNKYSDKGKIMKEEMGFLDIADVRSVLDGHNFHLRNSNDWMKIVDLMVSHLTIDENSCVYIYQRILRQSTRTKEGSILYPDFVNGINIDVFVSEPSTHRNIHEGIHLTLEDAKKSISNEIMDWNKKNSSNKIEEKEIVSSDLVTPLLMLEKKKSGLPKFEDIFVEIYQWKKILLEKNKNYMPEE